MRIPSMNLRLHHLLFIVLCSIGLSIRLHSRLQNLLLSSRSTTPTTTSTVSSPIVAKNQIQALSDEEDHDDDLSSHDEIMTPKTVSPTKRTTPSPTHPFITKNDPPTNDDDKKTPPKIAWLMSYPNSGTSFTMKLVASGSNKTHATNYGQECYINEDTNRNDALYPHKPNSSPCLLKRNKSLPDTFIITKTHCGGRCTECPSTSYVETYDSFEKACASGHTRVGSERIHYTYNPEEMAGKAIHLVRNPFDNCVSNFHLVRKHHVQKDDVGWLERYTNDANGFRRWCGDNDNRYRNEERRSGLLSEDVLRLFDGVPCHSTFYMFAQWHNLAIEVKNKLKLPNIIIWYEHYESDFTTTTNKIFDFLEMPIVDALPTFVSGKHYPDYFREEERIAAMKLVKEVSNKDTWALVKHYK